MKTSLAMLLVFAAIVGTSSPFAFAGRERLSGTLAGAGFQPDNVKLTRNSALDTVAVGGKTVDTAQGFVLDFAVGKEFIPDNELSLRFNLNKGEVPFGRTVRCQPHAFGTAGYRAQHYKETGPGSVSRGVTAIFVTSNRPAKGLSSSLTAMDKIDATISFDKRSGKSVSGTIRLRLEDAMKTTLSGSFTAKLVGF